MHILLSGLPSLCNIGGVQKSLTFLTSFLLKQGHKVSLHSWLPENGKSPSFSEMVYELDKSINYIYTSRDPEMMRTVFDFVEKDKPDVICVINSGRIGGYLLSHFKQYNIPLVYSIRGSSQYCLKYLYPSLKIFNYSFYMADCAHVLMPSYKNYLSEEVRSKIKVIPSPITAAQKFANTLQPYNNKYYILYSGRFTFEKRVHILIEAFAKIFLKYPEWDLLLVGNGVLQDDYEKLIKKLNMTNRCHIKNFDSSESLYNEVYPFSHIMVLPSEQEGCPMALREAMAHKIPVIAFKECSGANEIIEHNVSGLLVEGDNLIMSLASSIEKLILDINLRVTLAEEGYNKSLEYNPDFINSEWENLFYDAFYKRNYADKKNLLLYWKKYALLDKELKNYYRCKFEKCKDIDFDYSVIYDNPEDLLIKHSINYKIIQNHKLFDKAFYSESYISVKESGMDPLLHYLEFGWKLGYNPSLLFDNDKYIEIWMNGNATMCPLLHFYKVGRFKGAIPMEVDKSLFPQREKYIQEYSYVNDILKELKG